MLQEAFFIGALISLMREEPLWSNHPLKAPPLTTITLAIKFQTSEFWREHIQTRAGGFQGLWGEEEKLVFNGYRVSVLQEEKALEICDTTMWLYLTPLNYTLKMVKMAHLMLCVFYRNKKYKIN